MYMQFRVYDIVESLTCWDLNNVYGLYLNM